MRPALRRTRGFSLLELLTSIVVIAIMLALAGPAMERTLLLARARTTLNQIATALFQTRMEAVSEGRTVEMVLLPDAAGCIQGFLIRPRDDESTRPIVDLGHDLRGLCLRHSRSPRDTTIGFNSRGMLRGANSSFWYTDPAVPDSLVISIAGRVRRTP